MVVFSEFNIPIPMLSETTMKKLMVGLLMAAFCSTAQAEMLIRVFQKTQRLQLENNGEVIFQGRVTTGMPSHSTPNGVFYINSRNANAISAKYSARMPNALFFIGTKYAIHAGRIHSYRASHGCVRVSYETSAFLFNVVPNGTKVIISG